MLNAGFRLLRGRGCGCAGFFQPGEPLAVVGPFPGVLLPEGGQLSPESLDLFAKSLDLFSLRCDEKPEIRLRDDRHFGVLRRS